METVVSLLLSLAVAAVFYGLWRLLRRQVMAIGDPAIRRYIAVAVVSGVLSAVAGRIFRLLLDDGTLVEVLSIMTFSVILTDAFFAFSGQAARVKHDPADCGTKHE